MPVGPIAERRNVLRSSSRSSADRSRSDGWSGTVSVTAFQGQSVNGSSHSVAGESVPKIVPTTPQPVAVIRMPTAPSTRARAAIASRKTRTMLSQGKTSDHATARTVSLSCSIMAGIPQKRCLGLGRVSGIIRSAAPITQAGLRRGGRRASIGNRSRRQDSQLDAPTMHARLIRVHRRPSVVPRRRPPARSAFRSARPASGPDRSAGSARCKTASPGCLPAGTPAGRWNNEATYSG